jgi:hypothetical protein
VVRFGREALVERKLNGTIRSTSTTTARNRNPQQGENSNSCTFEEFKFFFAMPPNCAQSPQFSALH